MEGWRAMVTTCPSCSAPTVEGSQQCQACGADLRPAEALSGQLPQAQGGDDGAITPVVQAAPSRRPLWLALLAVGLVAIVAGGAYFVLQNQGLPAGTVQGRLVASDGTAASGHSLQLLLITNQVGDTLTMKTTSYKVSTDETGNFKFTGVADGKYGIIDLNATFRLGTTPSMAQMVVRDAAGKVLVFDYTSSKGLDLGNLTKPIAAP
jgi:hypothetical protein